MDNDNQLPPAPVAEELNYRNVADLLLSIGWRDVGDAQHAKLRDALPDLSAMFHHKHAIDVDALAEFLKRNGFLEYPQAARDLSIRICNWIEEQQGE